MLHRASAGKLHDALRGTPHEPPKAAALNAVINTQH